MKLFEKLTIAALGVLLAGSAAGITTTTILDNKRIDDLQSQINDLNTRADELQEQIDNLKEQYNALKAQEEADIARVTADYQAKIDDLQRQIDEANAELKALDEKYEQAVADLKAKEEADIAALDAKYASEVASMKEKEAADIKALDDKYEAQVQAIKTHYDNKISDLEDATEEEITALRNQEAQDIATLTNSLELAKRDIEIAYTNKINELRTATNTAIDAVKTEYQNKLDELDDKYQAKVEALNATIATLSTNITNLTNQLNAAIQALKDEYDAKINELLRRLALLETGDSTIYPTAWIETNYFNGYTVDNLIKYRKIHTNIFELYFEKTGFTNTLINLRYKYGSSTPSWSCTLTNNYAHLSATVTYDVSYTRYYDVTLPSRHMTSSASGDGYLNPGAEVKINAAQKDYVFASQPTNDVEALTEVYNYWNADSTLGFTVSTAKYAIYDLKVEETYTNLITNETVQRAFYRENNTGFDINTYLGK